MPTLRPCMAIARTMWLPQLCIWPTERQPTPAGDYHAICAAIADMVRVLEQRYGTGLSVGIGIPGAISPASGLASSSRSSLADSEPRACQTTLLPP